MWINKVVTLNWGTLPDREYPLGEVTLLAGHTGSGKSTLEDAIQTVMTAAHHGLFAYNPGQDEAKQGARSGKKARSLASYILGADRDRYARPGGAHGYVALVFRPSGEEDGPAFAAVFGVTASLEEVGAGDKVRRVPRELNTQMMLVQAEIGIGDLAERAGSYAFDVTDTKDIYNRLRERFGRDAVREFSSKESYLSYLWGALRGRAGSLDVKVAKRAAQTFSQAMAYKPIRSIDRFVKDEILRPKDVSADVAHLSSLVQQMHKMREDAETINRRTEMLAAILKEGEFAARAWLSRSETLYVKAAGMAHRNSQAIERATTERAKAQKDAGSAEQQYHLLEQQVTNLESLRTQLDRQRGEHPKLSERGQLEDTLERFREDYGRLRQALSGKTQELNTIRDTLRALRNTPAALRVDPVFADAFKQLDQALTLSIGLDSDELHTDIIHVLRHEPEAEGTGEALQRLRDELGESETAIGLIEESIKGEVGLLSLVQEHYFQHASHEKGLVERQRELHAEIRELSEARRVSYLRTASEGFALLQAQLPEAKPRVLCDLVAVRPSEEEWQHAIEGYLGNNRYMLIVEQKYEVEANRLLRQHPAKVAQTHRILQRASEPLRAGSIVECLAVDDPIAQAYLRAAYGDVVKVPDFEILRRTARGVMKDGRSAGGFATGRSWAEDRDLVFGESGRRRRLAARTSELTQLDRQLNDIGNRRSRLQGLKRHLESIRSPNIVETLSNLIHTRIDLIEAKGRLETLDLGDGVELEARYQKVQADYKAALSDKEKTAERRVIAQRKVVEMEKEIVQLRTQQIELNTHRENAYGLLEWLDGASADYSLEAQIDGLNAQASGFDEQMNKALDARVTGHEGNVARHLGGFRDGLYGYNQMADTYQRVLWPEVPLSSVSSQDDFSLLLSMIDETRRQHDRHKNHLLAVAEAELRNLAEQVNNAITANFCQVINRSLQDGRDQIQRLNRALEGYHFNDETYRFHAEAVTDMSRYNSLFDELSRAYDVRGERLDLFGDESGSLSEESRKTLNELLALLEQGDQQQAREKLEQITDYRNYHNYDVIAYTGDGHTLSLGESATGSGGQTETPAYVIRLAAISNAYGLNDERGPRLRSIVLDEAFSKMDEPRTAEVLRLFADARFRFQVVFAMPTKNAGAFQPLLTHKYVFTRTKATVPHGELPDRTLVKLELPDRAETRRLWDRHLETVETQARLEFEVENPELPPDPVSTSSS
jgi:energy-coupling factor transporter ATP-binding protein EcfA2